jgi:hypothetical protein
MLVDVINNSRSVIELHLSGDREVLTEVKYLPHNRIKKYEHRVSDYMKSGASSRETLNKIAIALAK